MERSEARIWLGSPLAGAVGVLGVGLVAICCTDGNDHASWAPPAAASSLTAALGDGGRVELSWSDRSQDEGGFRIERRAGSGAFAVVDRVAANRTAFDDDRAPADEVVEYRVIATSVAGDAPASNVATVLTVKPPAQPASAAVSDTEVDISWLDLTAIETGFRIERRAAGSGSFVVVAGSPAPANATSFRDVGLTLGAAYEYRVIAETPLGDSVPSSVLLATTGSVPLQVDTTTLPAALQSWPYAETVTASGGNGQGRTWSVSAGALAPFQLVDGAAAVVSGTPYPTVPYGAPAPLSFTLQVTDSASNVAQQAYTLGIDPLRITTHAGNGSITHAGDGAQADASGLDAEVVAVDAAGNVYASAAYRLLRVDATSLQVTTVAGDGTAGDDGDGGLALNATLQRVRDLAVDPAGHLFVLTSADGGTSGARIRRIDAASGVITRIGGGGASAPDDGAQATDVDLGGASRLAVDDAGNVYFVHGHAVRRIDATGALATVAGDVGTADFLGDGGAATGARFSSPGDLAVDPLTGAIVVADTGNHRVRSFVVGGAAQTVAGTGASTSDGHGEGVAATAVDLPSPVAVAFDVDGNLFVGQASAVRRVERATGLLRTFAGAQLQAGTGSGSGAPTGSGSGTTTGSGSGTTSGSGLPTGSGSGTAPSPPGDGGPALQATIGYVRALAVDTARQRVFVADRGYFRVRLVAR